MANVMTEDQAKTKWCPHVRLAAPVDSEASGTSGNRYGQETVKGSACIASNCMAWRWAEEIDQDYHNPSLSRVVQSQRGRCGLAGVA